MDGGVMTGLHNPSDHELAAISVVLDALGPLDEDAQRRIVAYLTDRFTPRPIGGAASGTATSGSALDAVFGPVATEPPADDESWQWAKEWAGEGTFTIVERRGAERTVEAYEIPDSDSEGFYLGHLRAAMSAADTYSDDSFVRVLRPSLYEDDDGREEHWIAGIVIQDIIHADRTDLMAPPPRKET